MEDFNQHKIIYPNMTKFLPFCIDINENFYHNDKSFHIICSQIYWLGAFLNSKLFRYCFIDNFPELLGGTRELRKLFFENIRILKLDVTKEEPFKCLLYRIVLNKHCRIKQLDEEFDLNHQVYGEYSLSRNEVELIDNLRI